MAKRIGAAGSSRRNPPEHSRFKKGQSGNPSGRPPGSRNLKTLLEAELEQLVTITDNGRRRRLTKREIIVKALVNDAAKGDHRARAQLLPLISQSGGGDDVTLDGPTAQMLANFIARHLADGGNNPEGEVL